MKRSLLLCLLALLVVSCGGSGSNDFDGDGTVDTVDCAPADPNIHPAATELCSDGIDNDCDGLVDCADGDCVRIGDCDSGDDDDTTGDDDDTSGDDDSAGDDDDSTGDDDDSSGDDDDSAGDDDDSVSGPACGSLSLAGTGNWLEVPDHSDFDVTTDLSLAVWVKPSSNSTSSAAIMSRPRDAGGTGYALRQRGSGSESPNLEVFSSLPATCSVAGSEPLPLDRWSHIVGTYDGSELAFYVNGLQVGTEPCSISLDDSNQPFYIGREAANLAREFDGAVASASMWSSGLSAAEVATLHAAESPMSVGAPVAVWHLNEGGGATALDSAGNGHDGAITGGNWSASCPSEDADSDGVPAWQDCDDSDASSTTVATDSDCDGVINTDIPWPRLSVGQTSTCVTDSNGAISCWGSDNEDQITDMPTGTGYTLGSMASTKRCALDDTGTLACWGNDYFQQISYAPTGSGYTDVSLGAGHACALNASGAIECWGYDGFGQVTNRPTSTNFEALATGSNFMCALDATDSIVCWGYDNWNQVSHAPTQSGFTSIGAGAQHTCALDTSGAINCWGQDADSQVTDAPTDTGYTAVAAGRDHSCAIDATGAISCWGDDTYGQVSGAPTGTGFTAIGSSWWHNCAFDSTGGIECWGRNDDGQLGAYGALCGGSNADAWAGFETGVSCPVAYWDMETLDANGDVVDAIGGNNLEAYGSPTAGQPGIDGTTFQLTGTSDYFLSLNAFPSHLEGAAPKSISAWGWIPSVCTTLASHIPCPLASFGSGYDGSTTSSVYGTTFSAAYYGGVPLLGGGYASWDTPGVTAWNTSEWHHITGTYDGTTTRVYFDGVLDASKSVALSTGSTFPSFAVGINTLWHTPWGGVGSTGQSGMMIDEVKVYDYALSDADVAALYDLHTSHNGSSAARAAASCNAILQGGFALGDGSYWIDPDGSGAFEVYCDMTTDGGGWTHVMNINGVNATNYDGREVFETMSVFGSMNDDNYLNAGFYSVNFTESYLVDQAYNTIVVSDTAYANTSNGAQVDQLLANPDSTNGAIWTQGVASAVLLYDGPTNDGTFLSGDLRLNLMIWQSDTPNLAHPVTSAWGGAAHILVVDSDHGYAGARTSTGFHNISTSGVDNRFELFLR